MPKYLLKTDFQDQYVPPTIFLTQFSIQFSRDFIYKQQSKNMGYSNTYTNETAQNILIVMTLKKNTAFAYMFVLL